jgi:hypothetical protein
MYKIINMNKNRPCHVDVVHADGRADSVMVMGPKRPVYLREGMKPAASAFSDTSLNITEVADEAADKSPLEQVVNEVSAASGDSKNLKKVK